MYPHITRDIWDAYITPAKLFAPTCSTQHPRDESQRPPYMKHYNPHMFARGCSVGNNYYNNMGIITSFAPPCSISLRVNMTRRIKTFHWIVNYHDEVIQDEARRCMSSIKYFNLMINLSVYILSIVGNY